MSGRDPSPEAAGLAADRRAAAAERLLSEHGVRASRVDAAGHRGEIAAVSAPVRELERLRGLAPEIKALGFKYVALDAAACPHDA